MALERAIAIAQRRVQEAEANRARFPFAAAKLAELRTLFPDARVVYAREPDGAVIGTWRPGTRPVKDEWKQPDA